jgi:F-type H+-transporting ATPase subunit a
VAQTERGTGINRWIIILLIVAAAVISGWLAPIKPHVQLPGENLTGPLFPVLGQPFTITNTLVTTFVCYILLFLLALGVRNGLGKDGKPSRGAAAVMEPVIEALYNLVESTAGSKFAGRFFPFVGTIILLVLTANMIKLVPGAESFGLLEEAHAGKEGYAKVTVIPGLLGAIVKGEAKAEAAAEGEEHSAEGEEAHLYEVIPFLRGPSTDLNFTAAIAVVTMIMVQVFGVQANGLGYFSKFFNFGGFVKIWTTKKLAAFDVILPFIDIFVGLLELVAEVAKIISFSFRLLGSMFGGAILFGVIATLLPSLAFGVYFLEIFFGVIQALVFGVLALVFMTVATQSHGHGGEEHAEAH